MGIDLTTLEAICKSIKYIQKREKALTLGRQGNHTHMANINNIFDKYNLSHLKNKYEWGYCEPFFEDLGFKVIDSLDVSSYEQASIIHDMNLPIPENSKKYNFILDGGTTEHIFNTPQCYENIINLLEIDGILVSVIPNNNLSGHGFYQFSPEFFLSMFDIAYGMEVLELYIAKVGSTFDNWINVNDFNHNNGGRNINKFNTTDHVYIIAISKKITNERKSLITHSPFQYSYKNIEWNK